MLGGVLHREQRTLLGPITEQNMADLHVDIIFAGAYGIDPDSGVTGSKVIAAGYHHTMLRQTDELIVVADATKLGRRGPTRLATIDQVTTLITDADAPATILAQLRDRGATIEVG
jgi:DeoR/GlpR family transcriptional regulator of sugar metabolism